MFYKNNWLEWQGEGDNFKFLLKQTVTQPVMNYFDELFENARNIRDITSGPLDLMFSGGIDSEVVLRVYKELNIQNIQKYEDILFKIYYKILEKNPEILIDNDNFYIIFLETYVKPIIRSLKNTNSITN